MGTSTHDRLRDYLVDRLQMLGCEVHVQSATGFDMLAGPIAGTVANVVARKQGTHPGSAVVLMAHYDAAPRSYGAGDNGAAVAAVLETLRALQSLPPLEHDLVIVFTDAEEEGLLGAEAFVHLHPWAHDVGAVLNFDGRGDAGPVYMFQTSPGNAGMIGTLARAVRDARTNSLTGAVYRYLPSDTDLSVWLQSRPDVLALNFAHIGGYPRYHTPLDNITSLDPRVIQHLGDYMLGMTRALGTSDLKSLHTNADAVYFTVPIFGVVRYAVRWALPLSLLLLVGAAWLAYTGHRRRLVSMRGLARCALATVAALLLPAIGAFAGLRIIKALHPGFRELLQGEPYNAGWYLLAFAMATIGITLFALRRLAPRATPLEGALAPLLLWAVAGAATALFLPGASYLFAWPLVAAEAAACWRFRSELRPVPFGPALALLAIPALVLWLPLIQSLETALTLEALPFCVLLLALVVVLLAWNADLLGTLRRPAAALIAITVLLAIVQAERTAAFSELRKRPDSLDYVADADAMRSWWISFDHSADTWTSRALGANPGLKDMSMYHLARGAENLLAAESPLLVATPSPVHVLSNAPAVGARRIHLHIDQSGSGEYAALSIDGPQVVTAMSVNGRDLGTGEPGRYGSRYQMASGQWVLRYFAVPSEGIDLWFEVDSATPIALRVATATEGFPRRPGQPIGPRPITFMSKPFVPTGMTIVERVVRI